MRKTVVFLKCNRWGLASVKADGRNVASARAGIPAQGCRDCEVGVKWGFMLHHHCGTVWSIGNLWLSALKVQHSESRSCDFFLLFFISPSPTLFSDAALPVLIIYLFLRVVESRFKEFWAVRWGQDLTLMGRLWADSAFGSPEGWWEWHQMVPDLNSPLQGLWGSGLDVALLQTQGGVRKLLTSQHRHGVWIRSHQANAPKTKMGGVGGGKVP